jgi:hypothetical protein
MAFPIAAIGMIAQAAGKGLGLYGDYIAAKMKSREMEYAATVAMMDAQEVEKAGNFEQGKVRTAGRNLLARQVALAAAAGRDISGGSPLAIIEASERAFGVDEGIVAYNKNMAMGQGEHEASSCGALRWSAHRGRGDGWEDGWNYR